MTDADTDGPAQPPSSPLAMAEDRRRSTRQRGLRRSRAPAEADSDRPDQSQQPLPTVRALGLLAEPGLKVPNDGEQQSPSASALGPVPLPPPRITAPDHEEQQSY